MDWFCPAAETHNKIYENEESFQTRPTIYIYIYIELWVSGENVFYVRVISYLIFDIFYLIVIFF